jgi:cytochrome c553
MHKFPRILLKIIMALSTLLLAVLIIVWVWSSIVLNRSYAPQNHDFTVDQASVDITEGERLARVLGCIGCHGQGMEGSYLANDFMFGRLLAPNLLQITKNYTDQELEVAIRQGIGKDGHGLLIMPSSHFSAMRDQDLSNIIAYLRQVPLIENDLQPMSFGPIARVLAIKGDLQPEPEYPQHDISVMSAKSAGFIDGRYLTTLKCAECHGRNLQGAPFIGEMTPSLVIVKAYDLSEFTQLMRTGLAKGGRELGIMGEISRSHFAYLRDEEITDLHQYLQNQHNWN